MWQTNCGQAKYKMVNIVEAHTPTSHKQQKINKPESYNCYGTMMLLYSNTIKL